jgi:hypothetical protein
MRSNRKKPTGYDARIVVKLDRVAPTPCILKGLMKMQVDIGIYGSSTMHGPVKATLKWMYKGGTLWQPQKKRMFSLMREYP